MAGYCVEADLLLGDTVLGAAVVPQTWIDRAADEIDSHIGNRYATPLDPAKMTRPTGLRIKRLNAMLATGRLLISVDDSEDLNAYGVSLVNDALREVREIENGIIDLPNVDLVVAVGGASRTPRVVNQDAFSATAAFENFVMGDPLMPVPMAPWRPGS